MNDIQQSALPSYKQPPLNEVVCSIIFEPLQSFKAPHLGKLWEKLKPEFSTIDHAIPIGMNDYITPPDDYPFPRIWFINDLGNTLIQIQNDRFIFNWRKTKDQDCYPRYEEVKKHFFSHFQKFLDFIAEENLGTVTTKAYELTYINHIPKEQGWSNWDDIEAVMPDVLWRNPADRFLPAPIAIGWRAKFELPDRYGNLTVKLDPASKTPDQEPTMFLLALTAEGFAGDDSFESMEKWFDISREWIVRGFDDLTGYEIQKSIWLKES